MLRGWDDGFDVPSLGIIVSPNMRNFGIGKMFISFLHCAAKINNSKRVRLKVYSNNIPAINFYKSVGYTLQKLNSSELVGYFNL